MKIAHYCNLCIVLNCLLLNKNKILWTQNIIFYEYMGKVQLANKSKNKLYKCYLKTLTISREEGLSAVKQWVNDKFLLKVLILNIQLLFPFLKKLNTFEGEISPFKNSWLFIWKYNCLSFSNEIT